MNNIPDINREEWRDFLSGSLDIDLNSFLMKTMLSQAAEQLKEGVSIDVIVTDAYAKCIRFYNVDGVPDDIERIFEQSKKTNAKDVVDLNFEIESLKVAKENKEKEIFIDKMISMQSMENKETAINQQLVEEEESYSALNRSLLEEKDSILENIKKKRINEVIDKGTEKKEAFEEKQNIRKEREEIELFDLTVESVENKRKSPNKDMLIYSKELASKQVEKDKEAYTYVDPLEGKYKKDSKKNSFLDKISNIFYTDD